MAVTESGKVLILDALRVVRSPDEAVVEIDPDGAL